MKTVKHLLLWERMGDYHRARWKALSTWVGNDHCYAADLGSGDGIYHWEKTTNKENHSVLVDKPVNEVGAWEGFLAFRRLVVSRGITHVSIPGYGRPSYLLMLLWSRLTGRKVLMFAESWYPSNLIKDRLKGLFLRFFAHRCLVSGELARLHFAERLGFPENRLQTGYSVVDNSHFHGKAPASMEAGSHVESPTLLCVARFAREKNLLNLIDAFKDSSLSQVWRLILVGGGPLQKEIEDRAKGAKIDVRNWVRYEELPHLYESASCFILPSQFEPWGLVVNEAMAAGLPVILSDSVGALPDLLEEGQNGWSFEANDSDQLVSLLDRVGQTSEAELTQMGVRSREIIKHYSLEAWASSIAHGRYCWKKMETVGSLIALTRSKGSTLPGR